MQTMRDAIRLRRVLDIIILAPALLLPIAANAKDPDDGPVAQAILPSDLKISEQQAKQIAVKALPGEITDATMEKKLGKMVWVIEIVAEKGGAETDVLVDMESGRVLGMER
jgi:uncharacterized membrane protein YkoI